jgi:ABC-2 type transport system ATP-binding protein
MDLIIDIQDLVKIFTKSGKRSSNTIALNKINLRLQRGTIFSFLGPNGAGKTTAVRVLSCLLKPTAGSAYVFGKNVIEDPVGIRARIGVLTENHGMYERMTIAENVRFFGSFYELEPGLLESRMQELLGAFNLTERANDKVGTLSKGLKQRAALVKTLIHDPELIFLDEPTSGLDPKASVEFREYIKMLGKKFNKTIFMCTHNLVEAQKLSDQVAIIDKGVIKKIGPPAELEKQLFESTVFKIISTKTFPDDIATRLSLGSETRIVPASPTELNVFLSSPEEEVVPGIVKKLVNLDFPIVQVAKVSHSLEDVYLKLMGGEA